MSAEFFVLYDSLVPQSGQAATVQGELVRAVNKLANDFATNGFANWDIGYERLCAFAACHLGDGTFGPQTSSAIRRDFDHIQAYGGRKNIAVVDLEAAFDRLMRASVAWCTRHSSPITHVFDPELKR
jgi:hypothetical protein